MKPETLQLLKNLGFGLGVLSLVGLLLWGAWHVVRLPVFTIDQVSVTGGETISHDGIETQVNELLKGEYWNFIPRRFTWTYPQAEILSAVSATPRVKDPVIERRGTLVQVTLAEHEPAALWCDADVASTTPCVFLNEDGYGFALAPVLDGGTYTRFSRVGERASTSTDYADLADFAQLRQLETLLAQFGWPVARIELDAARDAFVHLVGGGELKITLRLTPAETLDNLQTVLSASEYNHLQPGNFQYIDLRFGNKVFVNEFGDPSEEVATSTTETAASEDAAGG